MKSNSLKEKSIENDNLKIEFFKGDQPETIGEFIERILRMDEKEI